VRSERVLRERQRRERMFHGAIPLYLFMGSLRITLREHSIVGDLE
jgi:hypothetical protein